MSENWCHNRLTLTGPAERIRDLWTRAQTADPGSKSFGLLQVLRPEPTYSPGETWWEWRVENWGTKWDISGENLELVEAGPTAAITGEFVSAWSPPTEAIHWYACHAGDVRVTLTYHEPRMCFVGAFEAENGEVIRDDCYDYTECLAATVESVVSADLLAEWGILDSLVEYERRPEDWETVKHTVSGRDIIGDH